MSTTLLSGAQSAVAFDEPQVAKQSVGSSWFRLLVVPMAIILTQAAWWWEAVTRWWPHSPLSIVALVPVLSLLAGWWNLRRDPRGRQIHDRQLDLILCLLLTIAAVALLLLAPVGRSLEAAGASCLTAGAIVSAGWGSRALWRLRWPILLLLLTWVEPWVQLSKLLSPLVARLAVWIAQIASPGLTPETTPSGEWHLAWSTNSALALDPTAGGGVLLMVFVGLVGGIAWACAGGPWRPLGAVALGVVVGVVVAAIEWFVCVLWAGSGLRAAFAAWASGSVHLWTLLLVTVLTAIGGAARPPSDGRRRSSIPAAHRPAVRAIGRLTAAVPAARRAGYAVAVVCAVLTVLTARATSPSTYAAVARTITEAVEALWP